VTTTVPGRGHTVAAGSASTGALVAPLANRGRLLSPPSRGLAFPFLFLAAVTGLWAGSLRTIDVREITDLGLVSVLPASLLVAAVLLALSLCISLRVWPGSDAIPALHVFALIVLLYATPVLIEEVPRNHVTWRHVGIAELIARTGAIDPSLDVYSNWPGLFVLAAFISSAAGLKDLLAVAEWSPFYLNLLYLGPLLLLFRSLTADRRLVWFAAWLFYVTNWVGQDYFSPQGFAFFLYLSVFALVAAYLARSTPRQPDSGGDSTARPRPESRTHLILLAILLIAATVPTHQLTPVQIVISLGFVVLLKRGQLAGLLVLSAVLVTAWVVYVAYPFLDSHLAPAVEDVGQVGSNVDANVGERIRGSSDHLLVLRTRLALSGGMWALAVLGFLRLWRQRGATPYGFVGVLAVSPLTLLGLQSYGGEVLLRVYFFSLPFAAFLAAALIYPTSRRGRSWGASGVAAILSVALLAGFALARYGNERADTFTREEVAAVNHLYKVAPRGSVLIAGDVNTPWRAQEYEQHSYVLVGDIAGWDEATNRGDAFTTRRVVDYMAEAPTRSYLIITRSQKASIDVLGLAPPGSLERLERAVSRSQKFRVIYSNRDARIVTLRTPRRSA
jgi:hypothetical protein